MTFPISLADVRAAQELIAPHLAVTACRHYLMLDALVGHDIQVWLKHEDHQPTHAFKVRNNLSAVLRLSQAQCERGLVAATRGNHGQGLAWAGRIVGAPVSICVPEGNSTIKNAAMRALGAQVIESGRNYDDATAVAHALVRDKRATLIHSTNNEDIIAGAGTIALEIVEQIGEGQHSGHAGFDALVVSIGGGSQAVGALVVLRALCPDVEVYGVQAAGAPALHDSWHSGQVCTVGANTLADGLATSRPYDMTFDALRAGLTDCITVTDDEIANAIRELLRGASTLTEGAGAAGYAGLRKLAPRLRGKTVAVIASGGNIDPELLRDILAAEPASSLVQG